MRVGSDCSVRGPVPLVAGNALQDFIRNEHGSHNPREAMAMDDFLAGAALLHAALLDASTAETLA